MGGKNAGHGYAACGELTSGDGHVELERPVTPTISSPSNAARARSMGRIFALCSISSSVAAPPKHADTVLKNLLGPSAIGGLISMLMASDDARS